MVDPRTLTFAEQDELQRKQAQARVDLGDRLVRLFLRRFTPDELRFLWAESGPNHIVVRESLQRAITEGR